MITTGSSGYVVACAKRSDDWAEVERIVQHVMELGVTLVSVTALDDRTGSLE